MMSQNQGFGYQQQQNMYPQNYGNVPQYGTNQGIGNNSNMNKNMGNLPPQNYGPGNMQNK
jgi:hypothetical protein